VLLERYVRPGQHVLDPFAGSGTTLVQALESGLDATGSDIAAFNCLLTDVKTRAYNPFVLERELRRAHERVGETAALRATGYVRAWFAPQAAGELLGFRALIDEFEHADVLRVVLARAARSARRTTHFDLDFPREPQRHEYWCHTLNRIKAFSRVRARARAATILHGDARELDFAARFDGVVTSPPYPGLIDYHEQHRYAYELLGLDDCRDLELGAGAVGTSKAALAAYSDGIVAVFENVRPSLERGAPVAIVVNDRRELYPEILARAGLELERRHRRHVNRRTGRRAGEFFEDVLVCRFRGPGANA
jgi:hypothetical protein